jgi:Holliday junction resolvase RusA-like endonuclease
MKIPSSDRKKKKAEKDGKPSMVKPDLDNLLKGLFDAGNGIIWPDDNAVCELVNVCKVYSTVPGIMLEVITDESESA